MKQNKNSDWCIVKLGVLQVWFLNKPYLPQIYTKHEMKSWNVSGANKHLFFLFDSLFNCTSQQHGLYILSIGRMTVNTGKEVALPCLKLLSHYYFERRRKINHCSWPQSWHLKPGVKHHQQRMVLLSENLTF